jgi:hypothetical protein
MLDWLSVSLRYVIRVSTHVCFLTSASLQIECCIDEFATGSKIDIPFTADAYKDVFAEHLQMLDKFEEHTKDHKILPKLLQRLHNNGRYIFISILLIINLYIL